MSTTTLVRREQPLCSDYDVAMLDLDGVVYIGGAPVEHVDRHLAQVRQAGMRLAFITNNAARSPQEVAAHLSGLGVPASAADVVTSAQAAAGMAVARFGTGARIGWVGGPGLEWALLDAGLVLTDPDDDPAAIVTGYGPEVPWSRIMRAAVAVRDGVPWIASNTDATIPTPYGVAPGHGALVDLIAVFAGVRPDVAGKPARPLLDETVQRAGAQRPLMVGDRLDTDIEGGRNAGLDTLLVLTGVTGLQELVGARPRERPTYLSRGLDGLLTAHPGVEESSGAWTVGGWSARCVDGELQVHGDGGGDDWWRAVAAGAWAYADQAGQVVEIARLVIPEVAALAR